MDVAFCKKIKINANNAFKHFNVSWNVDKSKKKLVEFFEKLITFKTKNPNIKKLKKIRNVKKKTNKCNVFVNNKMNNLLN